MKKIILATLCLIVNSSIAQNTGDLDTSFGNSGIVISNLGKAPYRLANQIIQQDGKILLLGNYDVLRNGFMIRINADGSRDNDFNSGNYFYLGHSYEFKAIGLLSDGKIIVGGIDEANAPFIARINPNGTLDTTFGTNGISLNNSQNVRSMDLVILGNDKIVTINKGISGNAFAMNAFNADGSPDTSFSGDGSANITPSGNFNLSPKKIIVQADGKYLISGDYTGTNPGFFITRLNTDGTLDAAFHNGSIKYVPTDKMNSFTLQSDGKILVSCTTATQTKLYRYNTDGTTDTIFNTTGLAIKSVPYFGDFESGSNYSTVKVQSDGKIVIVTGYNSGSDFSETKTNDVAIIRFNSDGTPDTSFNGDGMIVKSSPISDGYNFNDRGYCFQISNDKYIISGHTFNTLYNDNIFVWSLNTDGSFDTDFDTDGMIAIASERDSTEFLGDSDIQPDGKIVLFSNQYLANDVYGYNNFSCLTRYNTDGSLDTTFGTDGKITAPLSNLASVMKVQPDGKILYIPTVRTDYGPTLKRLNPDGSRDLTFGTLNGSVNLPVLHGAINSIVLQSDGKIVLAGGKAASQTAYQDFFLARLNANGSLDTTFGTNGSVVFPSTFPKDLFVSVKIQPDGKIVAGGSTTFGTTNSNLNTVVMRFNADGTADTGFNGTGVFSYDFFLNELDGLKSLEIQNDGKIIGSCSTPSNVILFRLTNSGTLDTTFGTNGIAPVQVYASAIKILADQSILISGIHTSVLDSDISLAKYNTNGTIDTSFGNQGFINTGIAGHNVVNRMHKTHDNKILVAGTHYRISENGSIIPNGDLVMAKYHINTDLGLPEHMISQFGFYPNPAKDKIILSDGIVKANVYTLDGKKINSTMFGNTINLNGISNGIYLIELISNEGQSVTKKLIKE